MASVQLDTQHEDMIHDSQFDYYGKRLATASSDRTVRVFEVSAGGQAAPAALATLSGHEGPVWQVSWAHPKFGTLLASCSYDRKVIIWKEEGGQWRQLYQHAEHRSSVNSVSWCPHEHGLRLACCSSDGTVSILTHKPDDSWEPVKFTANQIAVNAVAWAPARGAAADAAGLKPAQLVTAGCDNTVKLWQLADGAAPRELSKLEGHTDWVRDVAWAPDMGTPSSTIASCSQDGKVIVWTSDGGGAWEPQSIDLGNPVWRVSWSLTGSILAVSCGDNTVSLWTEGADGQYVRTSSVSEAGVVA